MIYMKANGKFVSVIGYDHVDFTESKLDAFDLDKMPSEEDQKLYRSWIKTADPTVPDVEFVNE